MSDAAEQKGTESEVDRRFGDVEALFIGAHEAAPTHQATEGSVDDPGSVSRR
jgi:hypothetical protein